MISYDEIKALISLLDDPDREVFHSVSSTLVNKGPKIIPELEKAWEFTPDVLIQERLENIIQKIQSEHTLTRLLGWIDQGSNNILEGAYLIALYQYPELEYEIIDNKLLKVRTDIWLELNDLLTGIEKIKIFNKVFFEKYNFTGNYKNFYSPNNSFVNQVIDTRKGNQISLSILYISIAKSLGLPVYGVNLPKNFILAYMDENLVDPEKEYPVLFYINPYNGGALLSKQEIDNYLDQQNLSHDDSYYLPCSNTEIIRRLLTNIIFSFEKNQQERKAKQFEDILKLINKETNL
jgi:regulator of sirC expression with transglutaminase-like and TPR domain